MLLEIKFSIWDSVKCILRPKILNGIEEITAITVSIKMCHRIHFQSVEIFAFIQYRRQKIMEKTTDKQPKQRQQTF